MLKIGILRNPTHEWGIRADEGIYEGKSHEWGNLGGNYAFESHFYEFYNGAPLCTYT